MATIAPGSLGWQYRSDEPRFQMNLVVFASSGIKQVCVAETGVSDTLIWICGSPQSDAVDSAG